MPENTINPESDDSDDFDNFDWLDAADEDESTSVEPALTPEDEFALDWMADPEEETEIFDPEATNFDQNFDWTADLVPQEDDNDEFNLMAALSGDNSADDDNAFEAPDDGLGWLAELDDSELDLSAETVGDMNFENDEALNAFEEPDDTPDWLSEAGAELEKSSDLIGEELAKMESGFGGDDFDFDDDEEFDVNEVAAGFDLPDELEMEETNWLEEIETDKPEGQAEIEDEFMIDDSLMEETPVNTIPQINEDDAESMFPDFVDDIEEVVEEDGGLEWIETLEENAIEVEAREEPEDEFDELEDFIPEAGLFDSEVMSDDDIEEFDFAGAAAEADAPGWLANLEDEEFEEDFEEEPDDAFEFASASSDTEEDEFDEFNFAAETGSGASETPDWLADVEDEEAFEADFEGEVDEAFDFSSAVIDEDEPDEELAFLNNSVADVKADTPGYLTDADMGDDAEAFDFAEMATESETPDWLAGVDSADEDEFDTIEEGFDFATDTVDEFGEDLEEAADDVYEFAAETGEAIEDELEDFDFTDEDEAVAAETPDWLTDLETTDEAIPTAEETPDWLTDIDSNLPPATYELEADEDAPEWLAELNRSEEDEAVAELDDDQFEYNEFEADLISEEIDPVPADNAPDWLNAMVPGLDVDYEAPEDQPIEDDYVRAEAEESGRDPFEWLTDMVDDELSYPPESIPGVSTTSRPARFVFSKPPLWLRASEMQPQMETAVMIDDDLDQETADNLDFDEIGEDLPPWLSFEDDDDIFEN